MRKAFNHPNSKQLTIDLVEQAEKPYIVSELDEELVIVLEKISLYRTEEQLEFERQNKLSYKIKKYLKNVFAFKENR